MKKKIFENFFFENLFLKIQNHFFFMDKGEHFFFLVEASVISRLINQVINQIENAQK